MPSVGRVQHRHGVQHPHGAITPYDDWPARGTLPLQARPVLPPQPPFQIWLRRTDGYAITALIAGLAGLILWPAGVVAMVAALVAKRRIRRASGPLDGDGLATAGFVLGVIDCLVLMFWIRFWL